MDLELLKKEIQPKLNGCTKKQLIFFSWLCGVRALPFLGASRSFEYWGKKKQKYLYSVLYALDVCAIYNINSFTVNDDIPAPPAIIAAANANDAANAAANAAADAAATNAYAADAVAAVYGAYAIAAANAAADAATTAATTTAATAATAADAADAAADAANAANAAAAIYNVDFKEIILSDINLIKKDQYSKLNNNIAIFGQVWVDFQRALKDIGCGYWGKLYAEVFKNRFVLDQGDLIQRVNAIPREIRNQGAKAVAEYIGRLDKGESKNLNESRIIILGEKGAGKTCLARRLINPAAEMTKEEESTEGVETSLWEMPFGKSKSMDKVNAHIWDFAGHVITHAAHRCFLSERCLYIIVYNGRTEESNRLEYWLDHVKNYGGNAPVKILVNLRDDHFPDIPRNKLQRKYQFIQSFDCFSIDKDIADLKRFRKEITEFIQSNPLWNNQKIPASYFKVKKALQELFEKSNQDQHHEHITMTKFDEIAAKNDAGEYKEQLLKDLHELGICLWYKELKDFDTLILNPEWISHGIYKVINWAHNNSKYSVSISDYHEIFVDEADRYPKNKLSFIFQLMKTYELAYSKESASSITIPFLLKEDEPDNLPDFPINDSLMIEYLAEQPLPPNTISRLIVRHNEEIRSDREVWRSGSVLKHGVDTIALVTEEDRSIKIFTRGREKSSYIAQLRSSMNDIFDSYKCDRPDLQYRIVPSGRLEDFSDRHDKDYSIMLPESEIQNHVKNNQPFYNSKHNQYIPLEGIVGEYHIQVFDGGKIILGQDYSIQNTFNFNNCNFTLQGNLNELVGILKKENHSELAEETEYVIEALEEVEGQQDKKEILKSGALSKVRDFIEEIEDESSSLHKAIKTAKRGVKAAQSVAKTYNDIAQWVGLPQVPRPFLGNNQ